VSTTANIEKLSPKTKIFYGFGDIGNAVFNTAVNFFLMVCYTDGAFVAPALAGSALLIGKIVQTIMAYFVTYQLGMESQIPIIMGIMLVSVLIFLWPCKLLAERWNKGPAYAIGLGISGLSIAATYFLPHGQSIWIYILAGVIGIGFSANWVFPWAMVPDVVEFDQLKSGEARGGMFYGMWGFTSKLTAALGIAITGWVLQLSHYIPNVAQSASTLFVIRLFFGPVPALLFFITMPLLFKYPITRTSHGEVRRKLVEKGIISQPPTES